MSKKIIKINHDLAKEKIQNQYNIGLDLINSGVESINKNRNISRGEVDRFKIKYDYWYGITSEILNEIFLSSDYSYKFRKQKSSKVEYVNSSWQPDIKYYITKEMHPKVEYLKNLATNILDFDEENDENTINNNNNLPSPDLENITVEQILRALKPKQLWAVLTIIISVIVSVFYLV